MPAGYETFLKTRIDSKHVCHPTTHMFMTLTLLIAFTDMSRPIATCTVIQKESLTRQTSSQITSGGSWEDNKGYAFASIVKRG